MRSAGKTGGWVLLKPYLSLEPWPSRPRDSFTVWNPGFSRQQCKGADPRPSRSRACVRTPLSPASVCVARPVLGGFCGSLSSADGAARPRVSCWKSLGLLESAGLHFLPNLGGFPLLFLRVGPLSPSAPSGPNFPSIRLLEVVPRSLIL